MAKILQGPEIKTAVPEKSLGQLFFDSAIQNANRVCQVDATTDKSETFASVRQRSTRVALELQSLGITPDDVIAFCSGNTIDTVIPILGTFYVGAKVANFEPSFSVRQTQHLIFLVLPKIIFVEGESVNLIEQSLKAANFQAEIIVYGKSGKYTTLQDIVTGPKKGEEDFQPIRVDVNDVALMFFSSGTTGLPKAICHSHYSFMNMGCSVIDMDLGNVVLHFASFYWLIAMIMLMQSHLVGGCNIRVQRSFEAETVFKIIEKYKVTTIFIPPVLTYKLTNFEKAKSYDTSSLKQLQWGGAPMSASQCQELVKLFRHSNVLDIYGMTEIGYISGFDTKTDKEFIKTKIKSCGKPLPGVSLKVVNQDTNESLGPNEKGEILVRAESLMKGYYNADCSNTFDDDGFLKTGDVGYYDENGCIYIIERIKEMFKYQSLHVVPSALESVLLEHPAVKEAVVFGVPWGPDGEAPGACIVLEQGMNVSKDEIFDFVARKASDREKLRGGIWIVTNLPKTPTGKTIRKEVRDSVIKSL